MFGFCSDLQEDDSSVCQRRKKSSETGFVSPNAVDARRCIYSCACASAPVLGPAVIVAMVERKKNLIAAKGLGAAAAETSDEAARVAGCALCVVQASECTYKHCIAPCVYMSAW